MKINVNAKEFWFNILKGFSILGISISIMYSFINMPIEFRKGFVPHFENELSNIDSKLDQQTKRINAVNQQLSTMFVAKDKHCSKN